MANSKHKRGDTFSRAGAVTVMQNGVRQLDLTGWTGFSQLRDKNGRLIGNLNFSWVDATQSLVKLEVAQAVTKTWPLGEAKTDIELTSPSGVVVSTATALIDIVEDQSHV